MMLATTRKILPTIRKIFRWPGRRGHSLFFFSTVLVVYGQTFYTTPLTPAQLANVWAHLQLLPLHTWGLLWIAVGVLAAVGGCVKRIEAVAFAATAAVMAMWATGYLLNWITGHGYHPYIGLVIYGAFSAFILLISGWPEEKDYGER